MRKKLFIIFLIIIFVVFLKYLTSNYKIIYYVDNHKVTSTYKDKRYYINIDDKYSFDIYKKRSLSKLKIKNIKEIKTDDFMCLYPIINNVKTNPICSNKEGNIDYNLIKSELLDIYKPNVDDKSEGNFYFNNNLNKKENIYLWNYKGFYKMNGDKLEILDLFNEGKYDNSLMYQIDNSILFPDYNQEYYFKKMYLVNMVSGKSSTIESKIDISYNSYVVGINNNRVYIFDQKELNLYEINLNKLEIKLVGSTDLGYFKYIENKKVEAKVSEYKNKEIVYKSDIKSNYKYEIVDNSIYKTYLDDNTKLKIFEGNDIKIISEYKNILYFASEDKLYKYNENGIYKIFNYFELKFNQNKIIYIYNQ